MTLVFISDTHIAAPAKSPVNAQGKNRRLLELMECLYKALETAVKHKAEIIHGGDFFHDRKGVRPEALEAAGRWLEACRDAGVKVNLLVGNHDMSDGADGSASIYALSGLARVITDPAGHSCGGVDVAFMPYRHNPAEVDAAIAKMGGDFLVGHLGLGDPRFSAIVPADYETPGALLLKHLHHQKFRQTLLGHYHNKQTVAQGVDYMGCPLQLDKSDADKPRGLWLFHKDKLSFIENTWSPRYRIMSPDDALKAVSSGTKDYVFAADADADEAREIQKAAEKSGSVVRVERKPVQAADARMPSDTPADKVIRTYVDLVATDLDPAERADLAKVGEEIMSRTAHSDA